VIEQAGGIFNPATDPRVGAVSHVIQLAIAPVFVLTAVGTLLNVLAGRLARIVDRTRKLEDKLDALGTAERPNVSRTITSLNQRTHLVNVAITCCVICALMVCCSIIALFVGAIYDRDLSAAVAVLFIVALLSLTTGLIYFLREVLLATGNLRRRMDTSDGTYKS
jgi:uncharacterized membrane protein YhaH (DUF805 family)